MDYSVLQSFQNFFNTGDLIEVSQGNLLLAVLALPGYWVAIFFVDWKYTGRKRTQIIGFVILSFLYVLLALGFETFKQHHFWFLFIYGLTFFVTNGGPNTTTFVLPGESFPTSVRSTYHGFSAAMGKVGAAIGTFGINALSSYGLNVIFWICAIIAMMGAILSFFFTKETMGITLEEIQDRGMKNNEIELNNLKTNEEELKLKTSTE